MEFFKNVKAVKLVSSHQKYLIAHDNKKNVKEGTVDVASKNAEWAVNLVKGDANAIRLKSCYGQYLTAADEPFLLGFTGQKVVQTDQVTDRTKWIPVKDGSGVKLMTAEGKYLRANWRMPPWRNSVTHNVPSTEMTEDRFLWKVETVSKNQYESGENSRSKVEDEGEQGKKAKPLNLFGNNQSEALLQNIMSKGEDEGEQGKKAKPLNLFRNNQSEALLQNSMSKGEDEGEQGKEAKPLYPFGEQEEKEEGGEEEEEEKDEEEEEKDEEEKEKE